MNLRPFNCFCKACLFLLCVLWASSAVFSQGIIMGAGVTIPEGTALHVRGDVVLKEAIDISGCLSLSGNFTDHAGLNSMEGRFIFNGAGEPQLIGGESVTVLKDLEILSNAVVQLTASKMLSVPGQLINHHGPEGLVLLSDQYSTASLLHNTPEVPAGVQRYVPGDQHGWHLLSSPVALQEIQPAFFRGNDRFFAWHEWAQKWVSILNDWIFPTFAETNQYADHFLTAHAYQVGVETGAEDSPPRLFSGLLHQGQVEFTLERRAHPDDPYPGFNLTGNPYPSAIDWLAVEGWSGREHLSGGTSGYEKLAWVWNESIKNYAVIHPGSRAGLHNEATSHIPAMQGFWVRAAPGVHGEILSMDDRVRVHSSKPWEKSVPKAIPGVLRLRLEAVGKPLRDEVIIEYGHPGHEYGAEKLFPPDPEAPQLYVLESIPGQLPGRYSIRFLPDTETVNPVVLKFRARPGTYLLTTTGSAGFPKGVRLIHPSNGDQWSVSDDRPILLEVGRDEDGGLLNLHFGLVP